MALSTQSLASVTYQVSSLASAFLRLLDLQAAELRQLEAAVGCVAQVGPRGSGRWEGVRAAGGAGDPVPRARGERHPLSVPSQGECRSLSWGSPSPASQHENSFWVAEAHASPRHCPVHRPLWWHRGCHSSRCDRAQQRPTLRFWLGRGVWAQP